jgi:folate-binding protein YgfZ
VIEVSGADAAGFLHNQLTNDIEGLPEDLARLAGYCSAKGRLLATFLVWRTGATFHLAVPLELVAPLAKRLSMFVLRAKVAIRDASAESPLFGLTGSASELAGILCEASQTPHLTYQHVQTSQGSIIALPDALGRQRWLLASLPQSVPSFLASFQATQGTWSETDAAHWRWLDLRAGIPQIVPAIQDRFVPQMINFEALGGVNFKKGCYPGQEVVARSQYLGKLKRRMTLAHLDSENPPAPGADVFHSTRAAEAIGTVVNAERSPEGGVDVLIEIPLEASSLGTLHLEGPLGPSLALLDLPYPLPQNEVFVRPRL